MASSVRANVDSDALSRAIATVVFPQTGRTLVGLADLGTYRAAIEEAAG